jgi:hypothetical protein
MNLILTLLKFQIEQLLKVVVQVVVRVIYVNKFVNNIQINNV